jgi:hypothetical protein
VYQRLASGGIAHQIAAKKSEFGVVVVVLKLLEKFCGVNIARSFSGYQKIFHKLL